MDNRNILKQGSHLAFPCMDCEIEKLIGKGSNAIVYLGKYEDSLSKGLFHRVVIKELFPYHPENLIRRNNKGFIEADESAKEYFELQRKSFECGNEIHLKMLEKYPDKIGSNINTFSANGTFYSVLGFDSGKSLDKRQPSGKEELRNIVVLLLDILDAVEIFHSAGYLHLDISPDNILLIGDGESQRVSLIDYNSIHEISKLKSGSALYCSAKDGYTAPEVISGNIASFSESSDIYSVTAVFYRLLMGKQLTFYQTLRKTPPDIKGCPLLEDFPDTVISRVSLILRRGLCTLPSKRYKNCESMRRDVCELLSRIDGTGITHEALWESSRRILAKTIDTNPSLHFLKNETELYPTRFAYSDGTNNCLSETIDNHLKNGSAIINGAAGMGKTTALLHMALTKTRHYSPVQPAVIYVSLFDYNDNGENFIKNRILENLRFDRSVTGMEDARSRLVREFNTTAKTKNGEKFKYLLLIDGFNEADGNTQPLVNEILSLSQMPGVRILMTSRTEAEFLPFRTLKIVPLAENDIRNVLARKNLIYPESADMQELLKTPLMLSMYCRAAINKNKQLYCNNADELVAAYLDGICEKEIQSLPENSPKRWMIDAAVNFVLPFICKEISDRNKAVTDADLLNMVKKCFRLVSSGRLSRFIPKYVGHSKDICADAKTADEWYGMVVIKLLWHKTGLLIKEPDRGYKVMHDSLQEKLLLDYKKIHKKIKKQNVFIGSISAVILCALIITVGLLINPEPYDTELARTYLDSIVVAQVQSGRAISTFDKILHTDVKDISGYESLLKELKSDLDFHRELLRTDGMGSTEKTEIIYNQLIKTGKVMPWSGKAVNEAEVISLLELSEDIAENYGTYIDILEFLNENEELNLRFGDEFRNCLENKICADAALSDALFYSSCTVHLDNMKKIEPQVYEYYWNTIGENADLSSSDPLNPDKAAIEKLKKDCADKTNNLNKLEIITIHRRITQ